jgi:uncharacterized protein (DUF362 family)
MSRMSEGRPDSQIGGGGGMTRRRFGALAASGLASLGLPLASARPSEDQSGGAHGLAYRDGRPSTVGLAAVARGAGEDAVEQAVRVAAQTATDFSWLSRGDTVLIKPVCNSGNLYPATTDPVALRAVIRLLGERGARRVIVADMSGVQFVRFGPDHLRGSSRALLVENGLARAAEDAGAEIQAFEESGWDAFFEERPEAHDHWSAPLYLPNVLGEVDHVVLMPRCGRHLLAGSTLGLKAAVGWWRHDSRLEYHRDAASLPEKTAEANTAPTILAKQRLVVTSATKILTTFGPDQGYVAEPDTGLVIASPSVVAHDMASLAWLIDNRRTMDPAERDGPLDDPNTSGLLSNLANRMVTVLLGGFGAGLRAQRLGRGSIDSLWGDRVLRRAFEFSGGVPRVELRDANASVPTDLRERLQTELTLPA